VQEDKNIMIPDTIIRRLPDMNFLISYFESLKITKNTVSSTKNQNLRILILNPALSKT